MTYLSSQKQRELFRARDIANAEDLPKPYLAKLLQQLVQARILRSVKGPQGGFGLARRPEDITLMEVVEAVDGTEGLTRCAVGLAECFDTSPCPLHDTWKPLKTQITDYMSEQSLADLATALAQKKKLTEQNPRST